MKKIIFSVLMIGTLFAPFTFTEAKVMKKPTITPTALCKDGTYSFSKVHRGACSHHKGVRFWYK